jgi:hypothetical protein
MRPYRSYIAVLFVALNTMLASAANEVLTVAVFNFESKDEKDLGTKVGNLMSVRLSMEPTLITVERAQLEKILGEHEMSLSGNVSTDTAAKVGNITGAKILITGSVMKLDKDLAILAKIISTETSQVMGEMVTGPANASIVDLSTDLAKKVAKALAEKGQTLLAKVVTREERVQKLKKALEGKKLPIVSVSIAERHFSGPTIDPAAETEFEKLLGECGFKIADGASTERPDIQITGEALSEFGLRKGNLISCKGRVEIKIRERETGNIIVSDRQTSVAVDITEQTSAKTALQNAAMDLAERVIPKLAR